MKAWFVVALALFAGCGASDPPDPPQPEAGPHDRLAFKMLAKERTYNDCVAGSPDCTYVRLDYPVLVTAPEEFAVTAVTDTIFSAITANYREAEPYENVGALMQSFIDDYQKFIQEQPGSAQNWYLERKIFVLRTTPEILSLSLSERTYTGGAHGMATITFTNLSPRTGERLTLADVLVDGYESKLLPLAEAKFRETRHIENGTSFTDAGFTFFENGDFSLTDNFALTDDGLTFYYNVYEVAPYALGPTEIVLGYDELEGILKE